MAQSGYGDDLSLNEAPRYDPRSGARQLLFAATVLGVIGVANVIQGISELSGSKVYPEDARFVFAGGDFWATVVVLAGLLSIAASFWIFTSSQKARIVGIVIATVNAFTHLFVLAAHPWWALIALAMDILAIRALVVHGASGILDR